MDSFEKHYRGHIIEMATDDNGHVEVFIHAPVEHGRAVFTSSDFVQYRATVTHQRLNYTATSILVAMRFIDTAILSMGGHASVPASDFERDELNSIDESLPSIFRDQAI
jgi:hypothetical protein